VEQGIYPIAVLYFASNVTFFNTYNCCWSKRYTFYHSIIQSPFWVTWYHQPRDHWTHNIWFPNLRVLGSRSRLEFTKGGCWQQVATVLERTVDTGSNGVSFGPHSFSHLDVAYDVACTWDDGITATLGLELNWQKTKVQALGSRGDARLVEEFVHLGSLVHSTIQSSPDISCRNATTRAAMQNLDNQIWKSRIYFNQDEVV